MSVNADQKSNHAIDQDWIRQEPEAGVRTCVRLAKNRHKLPKSMLENDKAVLLECCLNGVLFLFNDQSVRAIKNMAKGQKHFKKGNQ